MWFKNLTIFQLSNTISYDAEALEKSLSACEFQPCLASLPQGYGWCSPLEEEGAPLVHAANGYLMICMQLEEKVLPATVVRQELITKIKDIEKNQDRKVYHKEQLSLKDDITQTLLTRAFSKYSRTYAYFDTKNNWLIVDSATKTRLEKLLELFKRTEFNFQIKPVETKKVAPILTRWVVDQDYPSSFLIEKTSLLKDPNHEKRVIRCQHQNVFAQGILSLINDGCHIHLLSLNWQDRIQFMITEDFTLKSLKFDDAIVNLAKDNFTESWQQQFDSDFVIMTEAISELYKQLLPIFKTDNTIDNVIPYNQKESVVA